MKLSNVYEAAWSPDGLWLATSTHSTVDLRDGQTLVSKLKVKSGPNTSGVAFTPDSRRLVAWTTSGRIVVHDLASGESHYAQERGKSDIQVSVDNEHLYTERNRYNLDSRTWEVWLPDVYLATVMDVRAHPHTILFGSYGPDPERPGLFCQTVRIGPEGPLVPGRWGPWGPWLHPHADLILAMTDDRGLELRRTEDGSVVHHRTGRYDGAGWAQDGSRIVAWTSNHVELFEVDTFAVIWSKSVEKLSSVAISPDGQRLLLCAPDTEVVLVGASAPPPPPQTRKMGPREIVEAVVQDPTHPVDDQALIDAIEKVHAQRTRPATPTPVDHILTIAEFAFANSDGLEYALDSNRESIPLAQAAYEAVGAREQAEAMAMLTKAPKGWLNSKKWGPMVSEWEDSLDLDCVAESAAYARANHASLLG